MRTIVLAVAAIGISGCAALQKERETRYMPERTIPATMRAVFVNEFDAATKAAIADASAANITRMIDSGSAASAMACGTWMFTNVQLAHGVIMSDSTANAVGAASTIAAGAFGLSPGAVAGIGAAQMLLHLAGQVEKTGLGAPDTYLAQAKMRAALGQCSDKLLAQAKTGSLSLAGAVNGLDACYWVCTPEAAITISTQALTQTEVVVEPSGALSVTAIGSTFQKDDSGARVIGYWMQAGAVNQAPDARLKAWMKAHGIETSIPFFAHSKLYEAARKQAVIDLTIPEASK